MSGRQEQDNKREQWITKKLKGSSQIVRDYMLSIKRKTSSTRKAYLGYISQYVAFMTMNSIDLADVKPMHIDKYIDYISDGCGPSIVNTKLAAVSDFYNFMVRNELAESNPCDNIEKLKIDKREAVVYMTDNEVNQVKKAALNRNFKYRTRDLCIITLGCATGLRVSALVNIDIDDIDFENRTITVVEKGNKKRLVYFGDNTNQILRRWLEDRNKLCKKENKALFISQKQNRISPRTVEDMIHNASKGVDKHITPHKMRSTCAMKLYDKTGDIYLTAQQLGHANIANTQIYARATEDKRREAAMILD